MPSEPATLTIELLKTMDPGYLLEPSEVAGIWRVDPKTVTRWAAVGKIASKRTPGGHRRYMVSEVLRLLEEEK